jgi:hypothetical protein
MHTNTYVHTQIHTDDVFYLCIMACHNGPATLCCETLTTHTHTHIKHILTIKLPLVYWLLNKYFSLHLHIQSFCLKYAWWYLFSQQEKCYRVTSSFTICWDYLSFPYIQANVNVKSYFKWPQKMWMCLLDTKQTHTLKTRPKTLLTTLRGILHASSYLL